MAFYERENPVASPRDRWHGGRNMGTQCSEGGCRSLFCIAAASSMGLGGKERGSSTGGELQDNRLTVAIAAEMKEGRKERGR